MSDELYQELVKAASDSSEKLQEFVENLEKADIISLVKNRIVTPEGVTALKYILGRLSQMNSKQKKRLQLTEAVLKEIQKRTELPNRIIFDLVFQIAIELERFSTPHLTRICDMCVDFIHNSTSSSQSCWKELLPKLLSVIELRKDVEYNSNDMSGADYKKRVVQSICMFDWKPTIITTLTAMFNELQLTGDLLSEVVNKLCRSIEELPPGEIPPFVHHLLNLCRENYANYVFLALSSYFNKNIYNCEQDVDPDAIFETENTIEKENNEVKNCESTVIYHIEEAAKIGHGSINQLLKFVKFSVNCPEVLLQPFLLAVLLTISSISTYEVQVMALLKSVFIRNASEQEKKVDSAWLRTMISTYCDMDNIVTQLIESRACENDKVMTGFINISLSFLMLSKRGGTQNPESLWKLGQNILVKLVQKHRQVTNTVLKRLVDCIFGGQNVEQHTECLRVICSSATFAVMENLSHIMRLVELLTLIPGNDANKVVIAIIPLVRISSRLRDNLISALRKALFNKNVDTKKVAVGGFLKLLKYLKVSNLKSLSQTKNSFQDYNVTGIFSQVSADVHLSQSAQPSVNSSSNEAICLEVVGILRRCFVQCAEVRTCLYEGLSEVIDYNPELGSSVIEVLLNHFSGYYQSDSSVLPPIDFSKAVTIQEPDAILQEPVEHLVLVIQQIVVKLSKDQENITEEASVYIDKFTNILESLVVRFIRCDLNHFELDEETNILDVLPECLQRQQILCQTIGVYEALMAYIAFSWTEESTAVRGHTLESLYKSYNLLYDYIKNCKPSKKKDGQKKDKIDGKKNAAPAFKPPETILNLSAVNRLLSLLRCDDLSWATSESTADLQSRRPLLRYVLQAALEAVVHVSKNRLKSSKILKECFNLGRILYTRCLEDYEKFKDFDLVAAILCVETFSELLSFITTQHLTKLPLFLQEIENVQVEQGLINQLKPIVIKFQMLLEDVTRDTDNPEIYLKREATAIVNSLTIVNLQLPTYHSYSERVVDYLFEFAQKKKLQFAPVAKTYISHMLTMLLRCKTESAYLENMAVQSCEIIGTYFKEKEVETCKLNLSILNESTVTNVIPMLCHTLMNMLESVKWLLSRLRSELALENFPHSSESPEKRINRNRRRERELVRQAGLPINIAQTIICISVPLGNCTEIVFQLLSRIFTTLTDITKYFSSFSSPQNLFYQEARFEKIVKLASFHLSAVIPEFILYIEDIPVKEGEKHENVVRQTKKQAQYIPRLTGDLETFTKCIGLLSTKCKDPQLTTNLKLTTARDFRVNLNKVKKFIKERQNNTAASVSDDAEEEEEEQTPAEPPTKKRRRVTK